MRRNQKLTKVIAGRTIKAVMSEPGSVLVLFDDQSSMKSRQPMLRHYHQVAK
jgi:hypothetical protein